MTYLLNILYYNYMILNLCYFMNETREKINSSSPKIFKQSIQIITDWCQEHIFRWLNQTNTSRKNHTLDYKGEIRELMTEISNGHIYISKHQDIRGIAGIRKKRDEHILKLILRATQYFKSIAPHIEEWGYKKPSQKTEIYLEAHYIHAIVSIAKWQRDIKHIDEIQLHIQKIYEKYIAASKIILSHARKDKKWEYTNKYNSQKHELEQYLKATGFEISPSNK